jgi:hypothetical protein
MALLRTPPLDERIKNLRAEIDTIIDAKAESLRQESPGVPLTVLRNLLTARAVGCECRQYLQIQKLDEETAARAESA